MGGLQVREGLAGVRFAAEVAVQDLASEPPPAEAEGQGERENKPAEGDPKGHQHHLLPDAEVRDGGGGREEEHRPADGPGEQPRLGDVRVDGGDEGALAKEVRGEPSDEEDQPRAQDPGQGIENEVSDPSRPRNRQGVDGESDRDHEDAPEDHEADDIRGGPPDARASMAWLSPHASARRSKANVRARRRASRPMSQPPTRPMAERVRMARRPGRMMTRRAVTLWMAVHIRSLHISVMAAPPSARREAARAGGRNSSGHSIVPRPGEVAWAQAV